jgi:hypothetical protein
MTSKDIGRQAELRWVPIPDMRPAPAFEAQRELREHWVEHLVATFDLEQMGNPTVNYRDGVYWILDGNHRVEALKRLGFAEDKIEVWTYEGLTPQQESETFLKLNDKLVVDNLTKFRVAVRAGRTPEVAINRIVNEVGARVTGDRNVEHHILAVGALRRVYDAAGEDGLRRVLTVIHDGFGDGGYESTVIGGLGLVVARYGDDLDDTWAIKKLGSMARGVKGLVQKGNEYWYATGNTKASCMAAAFVDTYNTGVGRTDKLPKWWR